MKLRTTISGINEVNSSARFLDELGSVYPEGRKRYYFVLDLPHHDPRTTAVRKLLEVAGWKPYSGFGKRDQSHEYLIYFHREYDDSDLDQFRYFELRSLHHLLSKDIHGKQVLDETTGRDGQTWREGRIMLERRFLRDDVDLAHTEVTGEGIVVPEHVRVLLANAGLTHVRFDPTVLVRRTKGRRVPVPWELQGDSPWWELTSDLTLPHVSDKMDLRDRHGNPVKPVDPPENGQYRVENSYAHAELRYRAAELEKLEPFDLSRTRETFTEGVQDPHARPLVASRQFRHVCQSYGLKVGWYPVHVDP
jgi:hypothetical protein